EVEVVAVRVKSTRRRNFKIVELAAKDETGQLKAVWFNQEYLKDTFTPGRRLLLFGKFERSGFTLFPELKSPQFELIEPGQDDTTHAGRIVPVYERIGAMSPKHLRRVLHFLVAGMPRRIPEILPPHISARHGFPPREEAIALVHFPDESEPLDEYNRFRSRAQKRLIFEELFLFFLGLELRRAKDRTLRKKRPFVVDDEVRGMVRRILPFRLTGPQRDALKAIADDLASEAPMRRLLQGDVGSGKTIVGILASLIVMKAGAQAAFMAPTEILAEQHFAGTRKLLEPAGLEVALLSSRLKKSERESLLAAIQDGRIDMVIGTHALIQEGVRFKELGLAIIDEQHRFGVLQRAELSEKGFGCDLLFMTATPIPRSLALTLHGDLQSSILDELPPGRKPIVTERFDEADLKQVFQVMEREIEKGHQVYFVCPLVEESEKMDLKAAVARYESLVAGPFRRRRVALVHGKMGTEEREDAMNRFSRGEVDVLVATTVVEVGVDVKNATLMVIEHAERFGLAQLHQLRGRVGRGPAPSRAVLVTYEPASAEAEARLAAMLETQDGFVIAERDLRIRGPGDYFGTRQSGVPLFRIADMLRDEDILEDAKREARELVSQGGLATAAGAELRHQVVLHWGQRFGLVEAG
ncbi:MAG TPA: ATP-dependent DNA helicase RecG, partial [Vicinamibacteria bacterium]|nr:ATP-dependent DNA helicase RecG [Vicinamibacteria bacterium]